MKRKINISLVVSAVLLLQGLGCNSRVRYEKHLVGQVFVIEDEAFVGRTLVQMDEEGNYTALALDVVEVRGNDSILLVVDTANFKASHSKLQIKEKLYNDDLRPITASEYDSLSHSIRINYEYRVEE